MGVIPGSARVSRAGDGVLAIANLSYGFDQASHEAPGKVRFGATPKPARETRALPNHRLGERPALAAESGAASVSYGVSEWALVWVSVSDCLKRSRWQLASESQLAWPSQLPWLSQSVSRLPSQLLWLWQLVSHLP